MCNLYQLKLFRQLLVLKWRSTEFLALFYILRNGTPKHGELYKSTKLHLSWNQETTKTSSCNLCWETDKGWWKWRVSHSVVSDSAIPWTVALCSWNSPGKNTGLGSRSHLQGIFPIQGSNPVFCIAGRFFSIWATREAPWRVVSDLKGIENRCTFCLERGMFLQCHPTLPS